MRKSYAHAARAGPFELRLSLGKINWFSKMGRSNAIRSPVAIRSPNPRGTENEQKNDLLEYYGFPIDFSIAKFIAFPIPGHTLNNHDECQPSCRKCIESQPTSVAERTKSVSPTWNPNGFIRRLCAHVSPQEPTQSKVCSDKLERAESAGWWCTKKKRIPEMGQIEREKRT